MYKLTFRKKIKKHLFEYENIKVIDISSLFLILIFPTLILIALNLTNMIPLTLLTELLTYFLVNQKLPNELLIKLIFLIIITFTFSIFSAIISSFSPILLLIFTIFWFAIYTISMFFGNLTKLFSLLSILYFLIVSLNLTILDINIFQTWLLSILFTIFTGFIIVLINYLKNDPAICTAIANCFNLDTSLHDILYTEELASEFSNKKLINLIEIAKDIKISKLNIDKMKLNLDSDVLIVFENIIQETDRLTHIINYNLSKNNPNFNISLKKFESKLHYLYKFKEQDVDIDNILTKLEELFAIFKRAYAISNNEFDENYNLPNLTSNVYVIDIIKANLNLDNIHIQNFIRFTVASIFSTLILVLTGNYNICNVLFALIIIFLLIKENTVDNLIYGYIISILVAICLSLILSMFISHIGSLMLIIFLICLVPLFKNNILVKDFIFITLFILMQLGSITSVNSLNYISILIIVSLIILFVNLIIYPHTHKINLYDSLSLKLKTNFDFVFEVLLSQNLDKYPDYWKQVSNKNTEFKFTLNKVTTNYSNDDIIVSYMDVSDCIDALTIKALAFNTHVNHKSEELSICLDLIKNFMDDIVSNLGNNHKINNYFEFGKLYSKINKFKKNSDDVDFVLAVNYLLWIVYDLYILSIFLDNLRLNDKFNSNIVVY